MAFAQPPTLASIRRSVAIRLRMGAVAEQSPVLRDTVDEWIRRAVSELRLEAHWVEHRIRQRLDLLDGIAYYDWPDNMDPGRLEELIVVSKNGDEFPLKRGMHPEERTAFLRRYGKVFHEENTPDTEGQYQTEPSSDTATQYKAMPLRYEIINEQVCLLPLPDSDEYPYLLIEGYMRPLAPRHNHDEIPLDEEAVIQRATVIGKYDRNHPDADRAKVMHDQYVARLRPMQSEGESIRIGGHFSSKFRYNRGRRTPDTSHPNYWLLP